MERCQRIVHLEATVQLPDGGFGTVAVDRGTVTAVGSGSVSIKNATGAVVTVKIDAQTKVRKARQPATLGDLKTCDQIIVRSRLQDGAFVARRIMVPPALRAGAGTSPAP